MRSAVTPKPGLMKITPYVGGDSSVSGHSEVLKLSSNENPLGPSPRAIAAFQQASASLARYPSSDHAALRTAIAAVHDLDPARIICGDGSDEVISWLCHAYAGPGDEVIHTEHGFSMYRISTLAAGANPVQVGETDRRVDVDKIIVGITDRTRLIYIANPANPTGTMVTNGDIKRLAKALPANVMLVLDGAYAEYVANADTVFDGGKALIDGCPNVFMTRTFSKIYGLGGLRVGWGYGDARVIDVLNRLRGPFNVSAPALAAAEAAVKDQEYRAYCQAENRTWRAWLAAELARIGIASDASQANFVLARFRSEFQADGANDALRGDGIIVRKVGGYNLPHCLRITVGDCAACHRVIATLTNFMKKAE